MLLTLAEANVRSLDDLADLDNEELIEILSEHELTDDAGQVIFAAARAHWFDDEADNPEDAQGRVTRQMPKMPTARS